MTKNSTLSIMEDLTERLDKINMNPPACNERRLQNHTDHRNYQSQNQRLTTSNPCHEHDAIYGDENERRMSIDGENVEPSSGKTGNQGENIIKTSRNKNKSNILIVTNVDPVVFQDSLVKSKFESLFKTYDCQVQFRYLKSFRRVRLDFSAPQKAELARVSMNNYKLGNTQIKCYLAQMIRPNSLWQNDSRASLDEDDRDEEDGREDEDNPYKQDSNYLSIPKRSKQFLLSPPISPPEGWAPQEEATPCIDVQLISALANLVPGEMHELHEGNESQPHIFVEVCEEAEQDPHLKSINSARGRIPKTPSPNAARD